jgi:hypothetical protein
MSSIIFDFLFILYVLNFDVYNFAVFMPKKEKIANTYVSAILNSNGSLVQF